MHVVSLSPIDIRTISIKKVIRICQLNISLNDSGLGRLRPDFGSTQPTPYATQYCTACPHFDFAMPTCTSLSSIFTTIRKLRGPGSQSITNSSGQRELLLHETDPLSLPLTQITFGIGFSNAKLIEPGPKVFSTAPCTTCCSLRSFSSYQTNCCSNLTGMLLLSDKRILEETIIIN